jgi:hypothetical protein
MSMKNAAKFLGIIALMAVIGFGVAGCKSPNDDPAHTHTWGSWQTTPATVTENGVDTITCTVCGAVKETKFSGEYTTGSAGLDYTIISINEGTNNAYRVSKGSFDGEALVIPAYHRPNASGLYLPVTSISNNSNFANNNAFGGTITGDPQTNIYNTTLTSVTITEGSQLKTIGNYAFIACTSLASITIPTSVTSIGEGAFGVCSSLTIINIPEGVTSIGEGAFDGCTSLTSITTPAI